MPPPGIRNKNPGNLRTSSPPWNGTIGSNGGFAVFDTMENGIRALAKQLLVYQERYGIDTIRESINRWAPSHENDTESYVHYVSHVLTLGPDDTLDFHDFSTLWWMVVAIGEQENGHGAFSENVSDAEITAGVNAALGKEA